MDLISEAPVALDAEGGDHGPAEIVAGAVLAARAGRRKRGSSLVVAAGLVADGRAGAMVSSGPTGAVVAAALLGLGRLPGVQRPALAVVLPVPGAPTVLLDAGASTGSPRLSLPSTPAWAPPTPRASWTSPPPGS